MNNPKKWAFVVLALSVGIICISAVGGIVSSTIMVGHSYQKAGLYASGGGFMIGVIGFVIAMVWHDHEGLFNSSKYRRR